MGKMTGNSGVLKYIFWQKLQFLAMWILWDTGLKNTKHKMHMLVPHMWAVWKYDTFVIRVQCVATSSVDI